MKKDAEEPLEKKTPEAEPAENGSEGKGDSKAEAKAGNEETLEHYKKKSEDYWDQLLRLQAEFINFRKRAEKEKSDAIRFGRDSLIEQMIFLADVMDQALHHADKSSDIKSLKQGFQMVVGEFLRLLKAEGLEPLKTQGALFDPHLHEAIEQVATDNDEENNRILAELQKGYLLNGKLLRPARVKVGKKTERKPDAGESETGEGASKI